MQVWDTDGVQTALDFAAFVAGIERGEIGPEYEVSSHIVTGGRRVRVGDMRLYTEIVQSRERAREAQAGVWPPPPLRLP